MCLAVNICSYFCEFNTMYHCIIVTFIKQTINILTFLTDNAVSLALLSPSLPPLSLMGHALLTGRVAWLGSGDRRS